MMIVLFFIIAYSIYKGLFNYCLINLFVSILLLFGFIFICLLSIIIGCYGKLGYFPFIIIQLLIYSSSSFVFIIYDYFNKIILFNVVNTIININLLYYGIDYVIILFNFLFILFFSLFINSIKHLFLIMSFFTLLLLIIILLLQFIIYCILYYSNYICLFICFIFSF